MPFVYEDEVGESYARRVLKDAQIRAMARRQLAFSIRIVILALFFAIISTFSFGRAAARLTDRQHSPASAPVQHNVVVLV
jgi:hypothetical protein